MIRKLNEELKQQKSVNKHGLAENANLRVQLAVRFFESFDSQSELNICSGLSAFMSTNKCR